MTRIFYSFILLCILCISTIHTYSESHLQITERTKEKVIVAVDSAVDPWEYKPYDLFRVYEKKVAVDGETRYTGYVDSLYIKSIHKDKIVFGYVWQDEWRNIEEGYYVTPAGTKYYARNEEIMGAFTFHDRTKDPRPKKQDQTAATKKKRYRRPEQISLSLVAMTGLGVTFTDDFSAFRGVNMEGDILFMLQNWFGIRTFVATDTEEQINYGCGFEYAFHTSNIRMSIYAGIFIHHGTEDTDLFAGITMGIFLPWLSSRGKRNFYIELDYQGRTDMFMDSEMMGTALLFNLKMGYRFF